MARASDRQTPAGETAAPPRLVWTTDLMLFVGLSAVHRVLMFLLRSLGPVHRVIDALAKKTNDVQYRYGYRISARAAEDHDVFFMNYGVKARDGEQVELSAADEPDRFFIQLYHEVVAGTDLRDKDVLEVSSGHGGGSCYLARRFQPRRMVGVDLTQDAVDLCRRHHRVPGLEFRVGNAVALPFDRDTFDAVICVEASHRYPSFDTFLDEVIRVLRPGGHLLMADLRWREGEDEEMRRSIERSGLELIEVEEITPRVIESLAEYAPTRRAMLAAMLPKQLQAAAIESAGVPGTSIHEALVSGTAHYTRFLLRTPSR